MQKIILLDHDGVICLPHNWGGRIKKIRNFNKENPNHDGSYPVEVRFDDFDKDAVKILNEIIEKTDAEIVISSDWKKHATLEELGEYYIQQGIIKKPIAFTDSWKNIPISERDSYADPKYGYERDWERYAETKYYVDKYNLKNYVIIDDLFLDVFEKNNSKFVHSLYTEGLKQTGLKDKIIKILNNVE